MNRNELLRAIENITTWKRDGIRAPHKPLLLLYALGCLVRGDEKISYRVADEPLGRLLRDFGPTRKSYHSEYPFWRLRRDGIWKLENSENVSRRKGNDDATKSSMIKENLVGGFPPDVIDLFRKHNDLRADVINLILERHFPASLHPEILNAVGLGIQYSNSGRQSRDPEFRDRVLRAYRYECAVCGSSLRLNDTYINLEAAHIKWHQAGGPDTEENGLCLCNLHHKVFDRGAFTISIDTKILVAEALVGSDADGVLLRHHGKLIASPIRDSYAPASAFLKWHETQVFHQPAHPLR